MRGKNLYYKLSKIALVTFCFAFGLKYRITLSETARDLIEQYITISEQKQVLETEVDSFSAQISFLESKIAENNEKINNLQKDIAKLQEKLKKEQAKLSEYLRIIYEDEQVSFLEKLFRFQSISEFMNQGEYYETIRMRLKEATDDLNKTKKDLDQKVASLGELNLQNELARSALEKQKAEKVEQLAKITEEEKRIRTKFMQRLTKIGNGASYCKKDGIIIKAKYPIFKFPTDCGYISQGFGNTEFAVIDKAYNGAIHNGVDVAINVGTPVKSIGGGIVYAKGSTPSGGWGNWVMIKQDKVKIAGKEIEFYALYAHLVLESHLKVGDRVETGTIVGLSGGTPDWPPHLHFSLFLSSSGWANGTYGPYPGNVIDPLDYMDIPISTWGTDWDLKFAH